MIEKHILTLLLTTILLTILLCFASFVVKFDCTASTCSAHKNSSPNFDTKLKAVHNKQHYINKIQALLCKQNVT